MKHTSFLVFISLICLAGCTGRSMSGNDFNDARPQIVAQPDKVSAMLAHSANRVSNALETLAAVEYAKTPGVTVAPIGDAPSHLRRAITMNWVGPAENITKTLADRASYDFRILGTPPSTPLVVSIDVENTPIIDVLRDIGLQLGARADLKVDGPANVVELYYPATPGLGG